MRWHVTALAAVWLIVMGWCGSVVMGQPVGGLQHQPHHPQAGQNIPEMWALLNPEDGSVDTSRDANNLHGDLYYFPAIPIMKRQQNLEDDSGWQSQVLFHSFFSVSLDCRSRFPALPRHASSSIHENAGLFVIDV